MFKRRDTASFEGSYAPAFFTDAEWSFLQAALDRLISRDDGGPDGLRSEVPAFIDRQMTSPYGDSACWYMLAPFLADTPPILEHQLRYRPRELYRRGIAAADAAFRSEAGCPFAQASEAERDNFLFRLAAGRVTLDGPPGQAFFKQLLTDIKQGYSADHGTTARSK